MTTMMREAIKRDMGCHVSNAIKCYEAELDKNKKPLVETYINLAFIYWSLASEPPFHFDEGVSDRWSLVGAERYPKILEKGVIQYPQSVELNFWQNYFSHILWGEVFTKEDCGQILEKYGDTESIVPYFFLYLFDKEKYREKRNQLFLQCEQLPTAKNRYIKSIIEDKRVKKL